MWKHHGAIHSQNFRYICDCSSKTSFAVGTPDNACSLQSRVSDYSGGRGPASLECQKPEAALVVTKLYEVRAKPEAEDTQLRTGSDTVSPSQSMKKKNAERKWKALKVSGRGWGSGSSRSLIDCTLQFLTVYISIYDSSASVSSNPALKIWMRMSHGSLAGERLLQSEMIFSVWFWASCWPNNPSETNGKQIKLSPSYTVGRYYTDLETL